MDISATPLPLESDNAYVYRLWDRDGQCIYVGQTTQPHPWLRLANHRHRPWWNQVARADYIEVEPGRQLIVEAQQIAKFQPRENAYQLAAATDRKSAPHGTVNGYQNYRCRCDDCREVWRAYRAKYIPLRQVLTPVEAADYLGMPISRLHALIKSGEIRASRFSSKMIRIKQTHLDEWLSGSEQITKETKIDA